METLPNFHVSCESSFSPNTERQLPAPEMDRPAPKRSEGTSTINTAKKKKKKNMNIKMIISQSVHVLKYHEKKYEFLHHLQRRRPFAELLQESRLTGSVLTQRITIRTSNFDIRTCNFEHLFQWRRCLISMCHARAHALPTQNGNYQILRYINQHPKHLKGPQR